MEEALPAGQLALFDGGVVEVVLEGGVVDVELEGGVVLLDGGAVEGWLREVNWNESN